MLPTSLFSSGLWKDKYNKKINKYYVEYEEDDESEGEDIEREICEETEAGFYQ